jgi:hypothetical protein
LLRLEILEDIALTMHVRDIPFRHFYLLGLSNILFGGIAITYSIEWLRVDPDPDVRMALWVFSFAIIGSMLFQIGVGFCMAWIMVPDTSLHTAVIAPDPRNVAVTGTGEKREELHLLGPYTLEVGWERLLAYRSQVELKHTSKKTRRASVPEIQMLCHLILV